MVVTLITIKKILGSIITSFLFFMFIMFISIHFVLTFIKVNNINVSNMVSISDIYEYLIGDEIEYKEDMLNYLEDYKNYIFYKRSYPTVSYSLMPKAEKRVYNNLKNKIDLKYENVIKVRGINNFIHNNSVYFLINVGIVVLVLVSAIRYFEFNNSFYLFSISIIASSLIILIGSVYLMSINKNYLVDLILQKVNIPSNIFKMDIIYMLVGLILFTITIFIKKKNNNFSLHF